MTGADDESGGSLGVDYLSREIDGVWGRRAR